MDDVTIEMLMVGYLIIFSFIGLVYVVAQWLAWNVPTKAERKMRKQDAENDD